MARELDHGLLDYVMEMLYESKPQNLHLDKLYDSLGENYEFSEQQLILHKQMSGQIEPNWMHDLRNLLKNAKSQSILINPSKAIWGIPKRPSNIHFDCDTCFDKMVKRASKFFRENKNFECPRTGDLLSISQYSDNNIIIQNSDFKIRNLRKSMVCSSINHLLNCGGRLPIGSLHNWGNLESAIIRLCDDIDYSKSEIVFLNAK